MPSFTVPGYVQVTPQLASVGVARSELELLRTEMHSSLEMVVQKVTEHELLIQKQELLIQKHEPALQEIIVKVRELEEQILHLQEVQQGDTQGLMKAVGTLQCKFPEQEAKINHLSDAIQSTHHYLEEKMEEDTDKEKEEALNRVRGTTWKQRRKPPLPPLTACEPEQHYHQPTGQSRARVAVSAHAEPS